MSRRVLTSLLWPDACWSGKQLLVAIHRLSECLTLLSLGISQHVTSPCSKSRGRELCIQMHSAIMNTCLYSMHTCWLRILVFTHAYSCGLSASHETKSLGLINSANLAVVHQDCTHYVLIKLLLSLFLSCYFVYSRMCAIRTLQHFWPLVRSTFFALCSLRIHFYPSA